MEKRKTVPDSRLYGKDSYTLIFEKIPLFFDDSVRLFYSHYGIRKWDTALSALRAVAAGNRRGG